MCKDQVLLQIGENCNGDGWTVGADVREGSREQKMCLRIVQTLLRREGNDWGWATFGSATDKKDPRIDRESATNTGTDRRLTLNWLRRNWALARTRRTPSSAMIWLSGRSASYLCCTSLQASRKQNGWKLLETSLPCVTRIDCFCKISSREMTPGATSSIRNQNCNRWLVVHQSPRDQKRVVCKNPRNLFLQVKPLMPHFTRQFWTDCYSVSGRYGQSCTGLENGCCSTIMPLHTVSANFWLRRW